MLTQVVKGRVWDYSHAVGGLYMPQPVSVAAGSGDTIYVLSRQYEQVLDVPWNRAATFAEIGVFNIPTEPRAEKFEGKFAGYGDDEGKLIWPAGIALDSDENIYVTDEWMNRVTVFTKDREFVGVWGTEGDGDGQFNRPTGIAVDPNGIIVIVDSLNHRVQRFTKDGQYLSKFGSYGSEQGQFDSPWGLAVDGEGNIYVADHGNHRAQKFTSGGEFVSQFGSYGSGKGQLNRPSDVTVDSDGDVYVCDWANDRVQVYAPDAKYIATLVGDAEQLAKWHQEQVDANADVIKARRRAYSLEPEWRFSMPTGVDFDHAKGRLLVADTQRGRLQIYNKPKDYMEPQFNL